DFLPFFGTGTVLIPWAVIKFFSGDYKMVIGLLIIWGVGQLARQIIQPKIVGESMGLPPLMTLFLLYLGFKLRGLTGMILAVPVGLVFINFYKYGAFDSMIRNFRMLMEAIQKFRREE
ncbi:AI-2E family transporter, partial [Clostridium sp.]|uniref:AI-2E family transporter n=1 Tax=Clostridium sp. TaxID=1506 RepID=UPI003078E494